MVSMIPSELNDRAHDAPRRDAELRDVASARHFQIAPRLALEKSPMRREMGQFTGRAKSARRDRFRSTPCREYRGDHNAMRHATQRDDDV